MAPTLRHVAARAVRLATAPARGLPDFLIIGAMKAGTTSLYDYLTRDPDVLAAATKEVHHFDGKAGSLLGYRASFPLRRALPDGVLTGEATPIYLLLPHVPARVARALPGVRAIVLLREPVDRALSHYRHSRSFGREPLESFDSALDAEPRRLDGEWERAVADPSYCSDALIWHSYLLRSDYLPQLRRWHAALGRDRVLVLTTDELEADPGAAVDRARAFLGLPRRGSGGEQWSRSNVAQDDSAMSAETRRRLADHFGPANAALAGYLERDLPWA